MPVSLNGSCRWSSDGLEEALGGFRIIEPAQAQQPRDRRVQIERRRERCHPAVVARQVMPDAASSCGRPRPRRRRVDEALPSRPMRRNLSYRAARRSADADRRQRGQRLRRASSTSAPAPRRIVVRAAGRLGDDFVDQPELQQIGGGDLQRRGGFDLAVRSRATGSRRSLPAGSRCRPRTPASARDRRSRCPARRRCPPSPQTTIDDRDFEHHHLAQVEGDRLGDAALLGLDSRDRRPACR